MKRVILLLTLCLLVFSAIALTGMTFPTNTDASNVVLDKQGPKAQGKIVIANRASGTISVIDADTDAVIDTITLPGDNTPEPMYVVYVRKNHRVFVGDRANNQVVAFNADDFSVVGTVPAGNGVFHMWAHPWNPQLWVNNDIDNTITVINPNKLSVITTVSLPADLVAQGGKPHDVILDWRAAYVTMLGVSGASDYVIKYNRRTFKEVARAPVGKDPHVIFTEKKNLLYVAAQNSNNVTVLKRRNLSQVTTIDIPGAHGVWIPRSGRVLYVTNLPGGGTDGLFTVNLRTNTVLGDAVDTAFPTPHNVVATRKGDKLYVTHSGPTANQVTVYTISRKNPIPVPAEEVTVGSNPFGLAFVPERGK
jgi:YVTN family beta-propeller protein